MGPSQSARRHQKSDAFLAFGSGIGEGVVKTIVLGIIGYTVIDDLIADAVTLVDWDIRSIARFLVAATSEVVIKVGVAYAVIAAADYFYQKFEFAKNMRMTKQEVKDEYRMNEGDPQVKGRIKTIQRQIAYKRMMTDVPTANVVVTNPTHFAVALKYETGKNVRAEGRCRRGGPHRTEDQRDRQGAQCTDRRG